MRQDVTKEQQESETQTKISPFSKRGLNNTKYVGYIKCFLYTDQFQKLSTFLHFMTSKFMLWYAI
jgi:hypothetical protein